MSKYTLTIKVEMDEDTNRVPIPMTEWGKDHWSTFAYIETRIIDYKGVVDFQHLQCNANRHPQFQPTTNLGSNRDGSAYSIRLKGRELPGPDYDEWDCIADMEQLGLLENIGTGIYPVFRMTELGIAIAGRLRAHKASGGMFGTFNPTA